MGGKYRPDKAFEVRVKWSVATGALIAELVSNWARKAQSNGLSIIPIPGDPFALPSQNSDPIRGPIYVELDTVCIRKEGNNLFQDFAKVWVCSLLNRSSSSNIERYIQHSSSIHPLH